MEASHYERIQAAKLQGAFGPSEQRTAQEQVLIDAALAADAPVARLPADSAERKNIPLCTGLLDYFPDALAEVARISKLGNDQHNPGEPLHWARGKSMDFADTIARHLVDRGTVDIDGGRHTAKLAWRALAMLQIEIEQERGLPLSRGSTA